MSPHCNMVLSERPLYEGCSCRSLLDGASQSRSGLCSALLPRTSFLYSNFISCPSFISELSLSALDSVSFFSTFSFLNL